LVGSGPWRGACRLEVGRLFKWFMNLAIAHCHEIEKSWRYFYLLLLLDSTITVKRTDRTGAFYHYEFGIRITRRH
jgi:hypothetical protein